MKDSKWHSAHLLMRHTFMQEHPAFKTTDFETSQVDWETIDDFEHWQYTMNQWILINFLKFLLEEYAEVELGDLYALDAMDRQAVVLALAERFKMNQIQDSLSD